jgi:hypothetical protein
MLRAEDDVDVESRERLGHGCVLDVSWRAHYRPVGASILQRLRYQGLAPLAIELRPFGAECELNAS